MPGSTRIFVIGEEMKVVGVCDYLIDRKLQEKFIELREYGADVELIDNPDLINNRDLCMKTMFNTEKGGAEAVVCSQKIIDKVRDADILLVHITPVNKAVLDQCTKLKLIGVMRGGLDSVNIAYLKEKGIIGVHTPMRSVHAVADFTLGMILSSLNNIALGYHGLMEGKWIQDFGNEVHDLRTRTVGIIGCGYIGKEVIRRLKGFGCRILACDPYISREDISELGVIAVTKEELLREADVISIHLRMSEKTRGYIGEQEFSIMKKNCLFINTARAGIVNQDAMFKALWGKWISGAAIDVFDVEPLPEDNEYIKLPNLIMTPHIAGTSDDTFTYSVELIYNELKKYLLGEKIDFTFA